MLDGPILLQFKRWPVDSVVCAQGRSQQQADDKRGPPAHLQKFCQDVRGIRPLVWPEEFSYWSLGQFGQIGSDFLLSIAPREVRIGLTESELRKPVHDFRSRKS